MYEKNFEVFEVDPLDGALVQAATKIEAEAIDRSRQLEREVFEKTGSLGTDPMLLFRSGEEVEVINQRDKLREKYSQRCATGATPILIPPMSAEPTPSRPPFGSLNYHQQRYREYAYKQAPPPLPENVKDAFLQKVHVFRDGERLYLWAETHFRCLPDNEVKAQMKSVLPGMFNIPNPTALITNVLALLKMEPTIIGRPDIYPHLVAVRNGEVDLRTLSIGLASPVHRLTHFLNVEWRGPQPCPVFSGFLDQIAGGDALLKQRIMEVIGYLLVADNGAKKFVVFQGEGDCGKSVLGNLISSFFERGDYFALADYQFGERFSMAAIANCHLCISMDLSDGTIDGRAVSMIKQITGGDEVSIEAKGKDAISDHIRCKILFGTNNPVKLKSRDKAFARRLLLVPFRYPVPVHQQDKNLLEKLMQERESILFHALSAYRNVVGNRYTFTGEEQFGFTAEQIVVEDQRSDAVRAFMMSCCLLDEESFLTTEALHIAFLAFCTQNGFQPISDRAAFSRALKACAGKQIQLDKRRVGPQTMNGYEGIALKGGTAHV